MKIPGCLLLLLVWSSIGAASVDPYEEMFGSIDQEEEYMQLINQLDTILREPVNLLQADRQEIGRLPWVSPWLAAQIVDLRRQGQLEQLEDLKKIKGVNDRLIELLRPFAVVRPARRGMQPLAAWLRARLVASPVSSSYQEMKTYLRSETSYRSWRAGAVLEKDRDEKVFNDFQAFYLEGRSQWGKVVVGNLVMASGHGLVFSNPYGYSPSTVDPWRFGQGDFGLAPYTSVEEKFALTGLGLCLRHGQVDLCLVASHAGFDAHLEEDGRVRSLSTTGYHTNAKEIREKDALQERLLGGAVRYQRGQLDLKLDLAYCDLSRGFSASYLDWISTDGNLLGSVDLSLGKEQRVAFVQAAAACGGGRAVLGGLAFDYTKVEFLLLARSYDQGYLSLHSRPFSFYSGMATGERGLFTRLAWKPFRRAELSIGTDLHERPKSDLELSDPSGSESYLDCSVRLADFTLSVGEKLLSSKNPPSSEGDATQSRSRLRSRLDVKYTALRRLDLGVRYENLRSSQMTAGAEERSSSDLLRLNLGAEITKSLELKTGFHVFDIGDYAARIYQYEPGLPYYPSLQMLKSDGARWYTVLSLKNRRLGNLALKYGTTAYGSEPNRSEFLFYYAWKL